MSSPAPKKKPKQPQSWRTLIRKPLSSRDMEWIWENLSSLPDQAAALTLATMVERSLELAIASRLIKLSRRRFNDMFVHGPMRDFEAKIRMGEALNLYDRAIKDDLNRIREIRNVFAHAVHPVKFTSARLRKHCSKLVAPVDPTMDMLIATVMDGIWRRGRAKDRFIYACLFHWSGLGGTSMRPERPRNRRGRRAYP